MNIVNPKKRKFYQLIVEYYVPAPEPDKHTLAQQREISSKGVQYLEFESWTKKTTVAKVQLTINNKAQLVVAARALKHQLKKMHGAKNIKDAKFMYSADFENDFEPDNLLDFGQV